MVEIRFHPEAQDDYQNAFLWYQARSPQVAVRLEAEIQGTLGDAAKQSGMFPELDGTHPFFLTLRRFPFSVVFRSKPGHVVVLAVAHSRRKPGYWQERT